MEQMKRKNENVVKQRVIGGHVVGIMRLPGSGNHIVFWDKRNGLTEYPELDFTGQKILWDGYKQKPFKVNADTSILIPVYCPLAVARVIYQYLNDAKNLNEEMSK